MTDDFSIAGGPKGAKPKVAKPKFANRKQPRPVLPDPEIPQEDEEAAKQPPEAQPVASPDPSHLMVARREFSDSKIIEGIARKHPQVKRLLADHDALKAKHDELTRKYEALERSLAK